MCLAMPRARGRRVAAGAGEDAAGGPPDCARAAARAQALEVRQRAGWAGRGLSGGGVGVGGGIAVFGGVGVGEEEGV